jgi:glutamyl-tRNA synthetase
MPPRGRYAPSPSGAIHLGNASTALVSWLSVRARGGRYVMRIEDLDAPRVAPGASEAILDDLAWLGLDWDEGPDNGGPHAPYVQSLRAEAYDQAFGVLRSTDCLYPCFCSRKDIQAAASAPQAPGDEIPYPGTCRALDPAEAERRIAEGRPHAWRFRVEPESIEAFDDLVAGPYRAAPGAIGDFVVRRADGGASYQLAVVVDDAAMRIDEVVRGNDLLPSTVRQILLYRALDAPVPAFAHVPLVLDSERVRLSKRHDGVTIAAFREHGVGPGAVVGRLARLLGLRPNARPLRPADLVDGFDIRALRGVADILLPPDDD